MTVADYIYKTLIKHNIVQVYSVVGGGSMFLNDAMYNNKNLMCTFFHHEQAAAMACESYNRLTNKIACLTITSGPAVLNALNGVAGCYGDSLGMIVISGNMQCDMLIRNNPGVRTFGDQEVDVENIVKPIVKCFIRLDSISTLKMQLEYVIHICNSGRKGVGWIDVPLDIQKMEINEEEIDNQPGYNPINEQWAIANKDVGFVLNKLKQVKAPLILAGPAIRISDSYQEFKQLVKMLNIPVVTTFNAMDVMSYDDPLFIGKQGTVGDRAGNIVTQNANVLLILGSRLEIRQVGYNYKEFAKNAYKIMIDIDKAELNKRTLNIDMKVNCGLKQFINAMLCNINEPLEPKQKWIDWCVNIKNKYPILQQKHIDDVNLNPYYFYSVLSDCLNKDDIIVTANGGASVVGSQCMKVKDGQRFYSNGSMGSMGWGLPAALGAWKGSGKRVICYEGDGSLQMNIQELATVKKLNADIKIILLSNGGYNSIKQTQNNYFKGRYIGCDNNDLMFPDWEKIAKAYGVRYVLIHKDYLRESIELAFSFSGPVLIEVIIERDYVF